MAATTEGFVDFDDDENYYKKPFDGEVRENYQLAAANVTVLTDEMGLPVMLTRDCGRTNHQGILTRNEKQQSVTVEQFEDFFPNELIEYNCEMLHKARHKHIVKLLGFNLERRFIVLEFFERGDLRHLIKEGTVTLTNHGYQILRDVAKGLQSLHSRDLVHLDLKSFNIMLTEDWTAKISGLTLVRELTKGVVETNHAKFTDNWAPPEAFKLDYNQSDSHLTLTAKSDIYSFGCVVYEIASGQIPWKGTYNRDTIKKSVLAKSRPQIPQQCSSTVAHLISSCWAHDPEYRPDIVTIVGILEELAQAGKST